VQQGDGAALRALVTNDDGIDAPGLRVLARAALAAGLEVTVAAPDGQRSGSGTGLSPVPAGGLPARDRPLTGLSEVRAVAVPATPAMIVYAAAGGAFGPRPDLVLSGVNNGPNGGQAVLHSGTVGAALTAALHGIPALALSLGAEAPRYWDDAETAARRAVAWFARQAGPAVTVNINLPDVPASQFRGFRAAPLASGANQVRALARPPAPGAGSITITFTIPEAPPEPGTDLALLRQRWAPVTVLDGLRESAAPDLSALA
jgi:5'-nucleotidase